MASVLNDPNLEALLTELHARSKAQEQATQDYFFKQRTGPWRGMEPRDHAHFADKLVALERDKAEFCYLACRALGARRIVELGTSFGVSTLYLAAAVRDNGGGRVVGVEHEPAKVAAARANFAAAGLSEFVDLREGDLRETLKRLEGPIDFALFDIWVDMARPALELIGPHLRTGSVLCADNPRQAGGGYADYFAYLADNGFRTLTLPFEGGLEFSVKVG